MSLKAKIEAVIYAAEEPVSLVQLASIFEAELVEEMAAAAARSDGLAPRIQEDSPPEERASQDPPGEQIELEGVAGTDLSADLSADSSADPSTTAPPDTDTTPTAIQTEAEEKKAARRQARQIREALGPIVEELIAEYANGERGMEIREIAGGYRMATKPEYHDAVRGFVKSLKQPMKLSLQSLETLAVIAYKQPVTSPEVSEIRGVDSGGVLGSLMARKLIATAGRKQVIGRPILYKTTKEFLLRFGLKDLNELPSMEEFEKLAGELAEAEAEAEDAAMRTADLPLGSGERASIQLEALDADQAPARFDADEPAAWQQPEEPDPAKPDPTNPDPDNPDPANQYPDNQYPDNQELPEANQSAQLEAVPAEQAEPVVKP